MKRGNLIPFSRWCQVVENNRTHTFTSTSTSTSASTSTSTYNRCNMVKFLRNLLKQIRNTWKAMKIIWKSDENQWKSMQISWQSMKSINTFDHLMKSGPMYQTSVKANENLMNINNNYCKPMERVVRRVGNFPQNLQSTVNPSASTSTSTYNRCSMVKFLQNLLKNMTK